MTTSRTWIPEAIRYAQDGDGYMAARVVDSEALHIFPAVYLPRSGQGGDASGSPAPSF